MPYFSKKLVAILSSLLFVAILIVGISFYSYNKLHENEPLQDSTGNVSLNQEIIAKDDESFDVFSKEKTYENQQEYIAEINVTLDKSDLDENTRKALLLRKAIVMSTLRGPADELARGRHESIGIFKDLINTPDTDGFSEYIKSFALVALASVEVQCCDIYRPIATDFPDLFNKYTSLGYSAEAARMLVIRDLLAQVPRNYKDDTSYVFQSIYLNTRILDLFMTQLRPEDRDDLVYTLRGYFDFVDSGDMSNKLFTDVDNTKILPSLYYAYGYDILTSYESGGVFDQEMNARIDNNYELAFKVLRSEQKNSTDGVSTELKMLYNAARYLKSMERRYADVTTNNRFNTLVDESLAIMQSTPAIKTVIDNLLKASVSGQQTSIGYFVSISKTNTNLREYLTSIGVTASTTTNLLY